MLRAATGLCALLVAFAPPSASHGLSFSQDYQRPESFRHAINAVIGDASYYARFGAMPGPDTDPALRVRTHLEFVHALLSHRDVSGMSPSLRAVRARHLERLRAYIDAGRFPKNHRFADQNRPCFIDRDGNICAVGYLVEQSAGRALAERINDAFQHEFLWRMRMPELEAWIAASGFSLLELSMIQPNYDPEFHLEVTQDSDAAPATVRVHGYVIDVGFGCGIKFVAISFSDDVLWSSPVLNSFYVPVDASHRYDEAGSYAITASAVAVDWCGNQVVRKTWMVTLGQPPLAFTSVQMPGGPPYQVYLQAESMDLGCLVASTVDWGDRSVISFPQWYEEDGAYRTPAHAYSYTGPRTVVVTNTYADGCNPTESGTLLVTVTPFVPTPTETATWGRVKALYR